MLLRLYIQAWASALLVLTDRAMPEPLRVGRVTGKIPTLFCIFAVIILLTALLGSRRDIICIAMDKQQLKEWQVKNAKLQREYNNLYLANNQKEKDIALRNIQNSLGENPFMTYCDKVGACIFDISRRGLDYDTERCIREIDEIASENRDYDY